MNTVVSSRPFSPLVDAGPVLDLVLAARSVSGGEFSPSYTRVRTLLGWRLWSPERDARVWEDDSGAVVGFAGLFPPDPHGDYLPLLRVVSPHADKGIDDGMLAWAIVRAQEMATERRKVVTVCVTTPCGDGDKLAQHSFALQEERIISMVRSLSELPDVPDLPRGFMLRSMPSPSELAAVPAPYGPLFARRSLDARLQLMAHPDYDPTLEIVAIDEEGVVIAFCESSLSRMEWRVTGRRVGEIDMLATHPDVQRRGLGRALLLTALHRLRDKGAEIATLFTESTNTSARQLYGMLGFTTVGESLQYVRVIEPL